MPTPTGEPTLVGESRATGEARAREPDEPPARLGRYQLEGRLGAGAFGMVYAARDPMLDREVAIKTLHPDLARGVNVERFRAEAVALAQLSHPNVVPVYDVGREDGVTYIVMQKLQAETLRAWMERRHTHAEIVAMFIAAGRGLVAAHALGVVHRDFKPENVLIDGGDTPRVVDFGLAQVDRSGEATSGQGEVPDAGAIVDRLTRTGRLAGTPAYMAPEQFGGGSVDARADQFAFSVALYEALAGARPFRGATVEALVTALYTTARDTLGAELPRDVRAPLRRGLALDPEDRFGRMEALLDALERRGAPARVWLLAALVAVVALGVWVFSSRVGTSPPMDEPPVQHASPLLSEQQQAALDRARDLFDAGEWPAALEAADGAIDLLADIPEAEAEAQLIRSGVLEGLLQPVAARTAAERAYTLASAAGATAAAARAATQVALTGTPAQRSRGGERWLGVARADASRAQLGSRNQARLALAAALLSHDGGDGEAALEHLQHGLELAPARDDVRLHSAILMQRARTLRMLHRLGEAASVAQQAFDLRTAELGATHPATLRSALELADALAAAGRADDAIVVARDAAAIEARATEHPRWRMRAMMTLGAALYNAGRYDEALEAITEGRSIAGTAAPELRSLDNDLAGVELGVLLQLRRNEDAHRVASGLVDALVAAHGVHHASTVRARTMLASVEVILGRLDEAEARYRAIAEEPTATDVLRNDVEQGLARIAESRGQHVEAARRFAGVVDFFSEAGRTGEAGDTRSHLARAPARRR